MASLVIALTVSGCSSWQATQLNPPTPTTPVESLQAATPEAALPLPNRLHLQMKDGTVVTLENPRADGDSLHGINVPEPGRRRTFDVRPEQLGRVPRAIALNDVRQVESKRFSGPRSLLLVLTTVGLVYLGLAFAYGGGHAL